VGQNLLGFAEFGDLRRDLSQEEQVIFVGASGFYSFRGYSYRQSGIFDRLQLVQGDKTIRLTREMHRRIDRLRIANAPELREKSLFIIPESTGFEPTRPWRLELLAASNNGAADGRFVIFPVSYEIPPVYLRQTAGASEPGSGLDDLPLWQRRWLDSIWPVSILAIALTMLLALLVFQDYAARQPKFLRLFRIGFLVFTLVFLGWVLSAQLSVINVLTFTNALLTGFRWEFFLLEPLIFILWSFVAVALLFWGRGVFCGWLCPFGALQELLNRVARFFNVPQLKLPFGLNERLWPLKYIAFLGLLAVSLGPFAMTTTLAEVEPFKTTISLKFMRAWPFVVYAGALLVASLFVQRVFCRYVCPLGGALAIPSGQHMFDWLKRRRQCGTECNICAASCPVQAIHPNGAINAHECIYCLDCQSLYYDDHKCPPLIERRKRREERRRRREQRQAEKPATA
jgi:polyferredoxin